MIYIKKQNAPKKMIEQVAAIKAEDGWKTAADTDTERLRSYFDQLDKNAIRNALYEEQHGLCAYCMRRIHNDESMVIEHWQPVKKNENDTQWKKDNALAYSNMLGCCDGGKKSDDTRKVLSCDASKSNERIIISPWKKEHIEKIVYRSSGRIATNPYDEELEHDINYVLHLNGKLDENGNIVHDTSTALIKGRREVYQDFSYFMEALGRKYGNDENKIQNGIYKKINEMESAKEYEQFIGVWLFFLRRRVRGARKK